MSFYGSSFSFDGKSCEDFGLMLYDFNTTTQGDSKFASGMEIIEDRTAKRFRSLFYGTQYEDPLEFVLVFGVDPDTAARGRDIDRQDMEVISAWLTGHGSYKWLEIDQADLAGIRYRCILTDLEMLEYAGYKWAMTCKVHCDSPFAYTTPMVFQYAVNGAADVVLHSRSSINIPYAPKVEIALHGSPDFSIMNAEMGEVCSLKGLPQTSDTIWIDGENGVLTGASGLNLYPYYNFVFPRFVRGDNHLTISGTGTVTFTCEFPVNVGG